MLIFVRFQNTGRKIFNVQKTFRIAALFVLSLFLIYPFGAASAQTAPVDPLDNYYPADIEEHWAYEALDNFINADLLSGYVDWQGEVTIRPNNSISRAEFVAILVNAAGLTSDKPAKSYIDVPKGKWYYEPIRIASSLGIVGGISSSQFGPDLPITRGDIAVMVVKAFSASVGFNGTAKTFADVPDYYGKPAIDKASRAGIVGGVTDTLFKPFSKATRAQSVVMLQRALDLQQQDLADDNALIGVAISADSEQLKLMQENKFDQLYASYQKFYTGYYLAYSNSSLESLNDLLRDGAKLQFELITEPTYTVVHKSQRFAELQSTGGELKFKITSGTESYERTVKSDGSYMLKKMPDNSWKIYAQYEAE